MSNIRLSRNISHIFVKTYERRCKQTCGGFPAVYIWFDCDWLWNSGQPRIWYGFFPEKSHEHNIIWQLFIFIYFILFCYIRVTLLPWIFINKRLNWWLPPHIYQKMVWLCYIKLTVIWNERHKAAVLLAATH